MRKENSMSENYEKMWQELGLDLVAEKTIQKLKNLMKGGTKWRS